MLLCSTGTAVKQSHVVQPSASTAAAVLLTSKPPGTAFSSAYFLSKLNCNCGLQMDGSTYICLLAFITICWFSYRTVAGQQARTCLPAVSCVSWMLVLGKVKPLQ